MCWPWPNLYWFWGQIWTSNFVRFRHDNSIFVWHTLMILHTCVDHDLRMTFIDLGVKRSKVKVKFGLQTFYSIHSITAFYTPSSPSTKLVEGEGCILVSSWLYVCVCLTICPWRNGFRTITPLPFDQEWWYFTHVLQMTGGRLILILGWKGRRSRSNFYFEVCIFSVW